MSQLPNRRTIRLKGYDYAQAGAYFATICTHQRLQLFGRITDAGMVHSAMGDIVQRCWDKISEHMPHVDIGEFIVMPDHVHGIIMITDGAAMADPVRAGNFPPQPALNGPPRKMPIMQRGSLGHIMQTFKAAVSRQAVKDGLIERGIPIWQRGYYEHIIRNAGSHDRIARYIAENPANWTRTLPMLRKSGTGENH